VDDSPESLPTYDSVSNLNVLNEIKHYTLLTAVPGNALNNTRSINETEAKTSAASDTSVISCSSIDTYPLVENRDLTKVNDKITEIKMPSKKWLTPTSIMVVETISAVKSCTMLKVLFDPGSTATLINRKCLPKHCKENPIKQERKINTLAGSCESKDMVVMRNLRLPELGFHVSSFRFPPLAASQLMGSYFPKAAFLDAHPQHCNNLSSIIFLDAISLPCGVNLDAYWGYWRTPHAFFL
jgi:hypothetical protein